MRIAVVDRDKCQSRQCSHECLKYCPAMRNNDETIVLDEKHKAIISEELCIGCGICTHKCPFHAIEMIGLPEELGEEMVHQYGENGFRVYRLPCPQEGRVIGLLGPNGIGKTTALNILNGELVPNLGGRGKGWGDVLEHFAGTELHDFMERLSNDELTRAVKPQYVDKIPKVFKGTVSELIKPEELTNAQEPLLEALYLTNVLDRDISKLSGGELQRVAIGATLLKDADIYYFDEPSSYLDIFQRLQVAKIIKELVKKKMVMVIEHDLAVLDFLADTVHLMYGHKGAYGVISQPLNVRHSINTYLDGYLREENVRFRDKPIVFESHPPKKEWVTGSLVEFDELHKRFKGFKLVTHPGQIRFGEVVGVLGPNATGKTTFVKMLAREIKPTQGEVSGSMKVSYKPQYIKPNFDGTVEMLFLVMKNEIDQDFFRAEIMRPLGIDNLMQREVQALSGGELQSVSIGLCIARDADIYLIDEPSAYLDSNQRIIAAKTIRRAMEKRGRSALIVEHDVYFIDMVADSLMVFKGEPGARGEGFGPFNMRVGMNKFLENVGITFRRDEDTNRPRINKLESRLDREQKSKGEFYYSS